MITIAHLVAADQDLSQSTRAFNEAPSEDRVRTLETALRAGQRNLRMRNMFAMGRIAEILRRHAAEERAAGIEGPEAPIIGAATPVDA